MLNVTLDERTLPEIEIGDFMGVAIVFVHQIYNAGQAQIIGEKHVRPLVSARAPFCVFTSFLAVVDGEVDRLKYTIMVLKVGQE